MENLQKKNAIHDLRCHSRCSYHTFLKNELVMYWMPLSINSSFQYFFGVLSRLCPGKGYSTFLTLNFCKQQPASYGFSAPCMGRP